MGEQTVVQAELDVLLDTLAAIDPQQLADGESIRALYRQIERLEAIAVRATASFEAGRSWESEGARSAAAWITVRCQMPMATARRRVHQGRALRHMPDVEVAWTAGEVNGAHVGMLAGARTPATAEVFARDAPVLVEQARRLGFAHFQKAVAYWSQLADPDGVEDQADEQRDGRRVHLSKTMDGTWFLDGCFDPISGAVVSTALQRIEDELFAADWADAKARLGHDISVTDLARTAPQRRADALVEMARRAEAVPADARMPEPLFTVVVRYETFAGRICELADGTVVSPGSVVDWLDEAWIERVVFDGPDRVMNVGVRRRIFTGATRRAVQVRDRECFHEFCDVTADDAQIDDIEPYAAGGLTIEANGRAACGYHNRHRRRRR